MSDKNNRNRRNQSKLQPVDNTYGYIPPQATEVEMAVLGSLMIDKDAFGLISDILVPDSFYMSCNQIVYKAIQELVQNNAPVDILTVTDKLEKLGKLDEVGGPGYVAELCSRVASSANIEYHANIIAQKHLARQLVSFGDDIKTKALDETIDVDDLMQEAEGSLIELGQSLLKKDFIPVNPLIAKSVKRIQEAAGNKEGLTGVASGFYKLDNLTSGWQSSDLIIIAGRPAMGKTAFALSMAEKIAIEQNVPIAFFSLEMSGEQLSDRLISNVCEIEGSKIRNGQLMPDEWERLDKRVGIILDSPLYVDETFDLSLFDFRKKARRLVREYGVKIIIIDYLQLMNAQGMTFHSRQEEVSCITRSLKGIAQELNIPIVALSQLNRGVENREGLEGKRPQLSDLRESGAIEQDADLVLFVHRPEYYHIYNDDNGRDLRGMAQIIIAKHRRGATGDILLTFKGEYTRFENPEDNTLKPIVLEDYE